MTERARHGTGLASIVVFPVVGALRLAGVVDAIPYALVAGIAGLFLAYALVEPRAPRRPTVTPRPPGSPLLH